MRAVEVRPSGTGVAAAGTCCGLIAAVVGTFLPWLRSGSTTRASYAGLSAVRDLWHPKGVVSVVVSCWPWVGLACGVAAAVLAAGHHLASWLTVVGSVLSTACAGTTGLFALFVLRRGPDSTIVRLDHVGPIVTLCGAATAAVFSLAFLVHALVRKPVFR